MALSPVFDRRTFGAASIALITTSILGCSSEPPADPSVVGANGKPRNADKIAQEIMGGKVGALVFMERVRLHPNATKFLEIGPIHDLLEGTSFDPLNDITRAYVTGPSASEPRAIVFAEHNVAPDRFASVAADMVNKSEPKGQVLSAGPEWRIKVSRKGRTGIVALLPPNFVVIVPEDLAAVIDRFEDTGGLPGPTGAEAARFYAMDPSNTLRAKNVPPVPPNVSALTGDVFVRSDGGVTIDAVGQTTAASAPNDAESLNKAIVDATTINIGFIPVRAFRPMVFTPAGDRIVTHHELTPDEVKTLVTFAATFIQ